MSGGAPYFFTIIIAIGFAHHESGNLVIDSLLKASVVGVGWAFANKKSKVPNMHLCCLEEVAFKPIILFLKPR
jgi:hypothetical protein